jgi:hypothetical protein
MNQTKANQISHYNGIKNTGAFQGRTSEAYVLPEPDMARYHTMCNAIINKPKTKQPKAVNVRLKGGKLKKLRGSYTLEEISQKSKVNRATLNNAERSMRLNRTNAEKICRFYRVNLEEFIVNN